MIVTAQPFLNELDLLEVKFRELEGEVDAHIVVEANRTFTGKVKPLLFAQNRERFAKWNVIYRAVALPEGGTDPWAREYLQYEAMRALVAETASEICLWVDADELPRRGTVQRFRESGYRSATLGMDFLMYDFSHQLPGRVWTNGKIGFYDKEQPQLWRGSEGLPIFEDAGWHCEFFGGREVVTLKCHSTSHAVEPQSAPFRKMIEVGERPGIEDTLDYSLEKWPIAAREKWEQTRQCV